MFIIAMGIAAAAIDAAILGILASPLLLNNALRIKVSNFGYFAVKIPGGTVGGTNASKTAPTTIWAAPNTDNIIEVISINVDKPVIAWVNLFNCVPIVFNDVTKPFRVVIIFRIVGLFGLGQPLANTVFNIGGICLGSSANEKDPKFVNWARKLSSIAFVATGIASFLAVKAPICGSNPLVPLFRLASKVLIWSCIFCCSAVAFSFALVISFSTISVINCLTILIAIGIRATIIFLPKFVIIIPNLAVPLGLLVLALLIAVASTGITFWALSAFIASSFARCVSICWGVGGGVGGGRGFTTLTTTRSTAIPTFSKAFLVLLIIKLAKRSRLGVSGGNETILSVRIVPAKPRGAEVGNVEDTFKLNPELLKITSCL